MAFRSRLGDLQLQRPRTSSGGVSASDRVPFASILPPPESSRRTLLVFVRNFA